MTGSVSTLVGAVIVGAMTISTPARAHPAPFSYLDLHVDAGEVRGTLVVHDFDAAYELGIEDPSALLDPAVAAARGDELVRLIAGRLGIERDGERAGLACEPVEPLPAQDSLRLAFALESRAPDAPVGRIAVDTVLFPYDPGHQTFVNVHENGALERQAILDADRPRFEHYTGERQPALAVFGRFLVAGVEHILIGPDHIAFLVGLLLLGGSLWRIASIVTAFTLGHSVTLSLAALGWFRLAPAVVEPVIALSIVVVGVDNLLVRRRRVVEPAYAGADLRPWLAVVFGLIHGFGFAAVLGEIGLPRAALASSLAGFNAGVELGQLAIVAVALALLAAIRRSSVDWAERCGLAGSIAVVLAGVYWFMQRVGWIV